MELWSECYTLACSSGVDQVCVMTDSLVCVFLRVHIRARSSMDRGLVIEVGEQQQESIKTVYTIEKTVCR